MVSRRQLLKLSALGTATFAAPLAYSASNITMTHKNGSPLGSPSLKDADDNALKSEIANTSSPLKGAGMVGWMREPLTQSITTVHQMLDAQPVSPWEFANLVTSRPVALDPSTWDWAPAFIGMHAAVVAGVAKVIILKGEFRLVGGLSSRNCQWSDVTIISAGANLVIEDPVGDNVGLQLGSNVNITGYLKVSIASGIGNGNGFARTPICVGRWWDLEEVTNVQIDSLDLKGLVDGTAMAIAGNTHGVSIGRLKLNGGKLGLMMHWSGFPENIAPTHTYHPHNIHIGSITGAEYTDTMVTASGCYDIRIDYIKGKDNYRDFCHIGGDFGEVFAIERDAGKVCKGSSIGRVHTVGTKFCSIDYNASAGKTQNVMLGEFSVDSIKAVGIEGVSAVGLRIEDRDSGRIGFADISNFDNNIVQVKCSGGMDGELRSLGATKGGIIYSATKHVRVEQLRTTNDNTSAGGGVAGVNIDSRCSDINIGAIRVVTNNSATHGCVLEPGSSDIRIQQANGTVDPTRYLIVDGAVSNSNRIGPCVQDDGVVSYSGEDPTSSTTARGQSISWGGREPKSGTYRRGDISMAASATPGGDVGLICTTAGVAGSTAVFKPWGSIDRVK